MKNFKFKAVHNQTGEVINLERIPQYSDEGEYMISPNGLLYEVYVSESELCMDRVDATLTIIKSK